VVEARGAKEAIEILKSGELVDVVFSDVRMPRDLNGFELAAWVHAHHPHMHVILTSGYSNQSHIVEFQKYETFTHGHGVTVSLQHLPERGLPKLGKAGGLLPALQPRLCLRSPSLRVSLAVEGGRDGLSALDPDAYLPLRSMPPNGRHEIPQWDQSGTSVDFSGVRRAGRRAETLIGPQVQMVGGAGIEPATPRV